jgi:ABC-2 type transport system permease protein
VAATAFASLAITLVVRREQGLLKRVRGTPLSPATYLSAVISSMVIVIGLQVVAQLLVGRYLLDADWPAAAVAFAVVILFGAAAFAALGVAITGFVRSSDGSSAIVNAVYLPMAFISGAFFSTEDMPAVLEAISKVLPLTHLLELIRATFIEGKGLSGSAGPLLAVALWGVAGLAIAVRRFRWEPREGMGTA